MPANYNPNHLSQVPITQLKGVGAAVATKLEKLGLLSVQDVLFHLPSRYQDRTRIQPIGSTRMGAEVLIQGNVEHCDIVFGKRRMLVCRLTDGSGSIQLRFFHFSAAQKNALTNGATVRCFGEIRFNANGREIVHPEYKVLNDVQAPLDEHLTATYPSTDGVSQHLLRKLAQQSLQRLNTGNTINELLPSSQTQWPSIIEALNFIHNPPPGVNTTSLENGTHRHQQRLSLEELLAHHLSLLQRRQEVKQQDAPAFPVSKSLHHKFLQQLDFSPTNAQHRVCLEIGKDLIQSSPMLRLVQGDVGCGKTLVAAWAALQVIEHGYQVALMAPTEILAEQHLLTFTEWFSPLDIKVGWLTGKLKGKKRKQQLSELESGECQIIIGTHALFQGDVHYQQLGLAIIDEQHRFGVHQRLSLTQKSHDSYVPHQLIMTATPIPRTLAMSAYADLDTSIIDELPPGRTPVSTVAIPNSQRDMVVQRVLNACEAGKQVYWVCTLIEESEVLECQAAEDTAQQLSLALPNIAIGLVHGRLKAQEKVDIMNSFKQGDIQLLVATTVIEVGVNVPNASVMIIENPERLGLAQLHQLRGRVGRGSIKSFCLLLYKTPLSKHGKERLEIMRETNDGFQIAEKDLELRGPGEVLGTRQTGDIMFRIADLMRDQELVYEAKKLAIHIINQQPELIAPLVHRWLGNASQYAQV
ncbi:MAG: ATP-dependent DNA helicase RecG [Moraxellaceae bacterium]|nr:MAG: ATP-dependent DNA helicase RecG [Moraxellaceae bacterium]